MTMYCQGPGEGTMRYCSIRSTLTDPYRAGYEIGAALAAIAPEVILLFASISYDPDFSDFFDALHDGLGGRAALVFGGTGDGIYETSGTENYGVCALGITSNGAVTWSAFLEQGVKADSFAAAEACARKAREACDGAPAFCMALADGTKADGHAIVSGISAVLPGSFFGGLTGDDRKFTRSKLFLNGKEYADAVAILTGSGAVNWAVSAAAGWTPVGAPGVVEDNNGCEIRNISGRTALDFMSAELGKPLGEADLGTVPLAAYLKASDTHFAMRAPSHVDPEQGSVTTFGSVETGCTVRVCTASRQDLLKAVAEALGQLDQTVLGFTPAAAIIISCAGRKWLTGDQGEKELALLQQTLGTSLPLIGFPSFGEISPFRNADGSYSPVNFHNVTFVVCLMG